jgi:hypothetical protein
MEKKNKTLGKKDVKILILCTYINYYHYYYYYYYYYFYYYCCIFPSTESKLFWYLERRGNDPLLSCW